MDNVRIIDIFLRPLFVFKSPQCFDSSKTFKEKYISEYQDTNVKSVCEYKPNKALTLLLNIFPEFN